ncbi:MAG: ShlB/FhaC/HecB family hemolysin secretion/activation protein [Pleurocapsa sp. SU_5_0]|nr:ShlB/FhaC/HecB family hemolysin secretion/activation protein [Pleurocapsa sp. SU_5_0]NJO98007.1 ShlB/FhaC/HecB family hemolysin secretion/activation protein [Pleurocapsa sp. CRU_1_2]
MEKVYVHFGLSASIFSLIYLAKSPLTVKAQPAPDELPNQETIQQTIPSNPQTIPENNPASKKKKPTISVPGGLDSAQCELSVNQSDRNYADRFFIRDIKVIGNTVLQSEIKKIVKDSQLKYRTATFEDLVCLRSRITQLYLDKGYVTSGAFLANNQDLTKGIVTIQVVEGELEDIVITGLGHLRQSYLRSRLELAAQKPLNKNDLETGLQLLVINPLFETVDAELTAGQKTGSNVLLIKVKQARSFSAGIGVDNYRAPSIGEVQGSVNLAHNNLLGFGDRLSAEYGVTEGLDIYNASYTIPWNAYDGTLGLSYNRSDSGIIEARFREIDIESETETYGVSLRQPLTRSPNQEFILGLGLDLRRRRTFLDDEPYSFSVGVEDGKSNATVLRFSQDWVKRDAKSVLAARSQFNLGIDAFDATNNSTGTDGQFLIWQGQFQWVEQLSPRVLFIARVGGQFTADSLLSLEKFSLGGVSAVRGYEENQLVTDSGVLGTLELRIPVTKNPNTLQLNPFVEFGTGWNNDEPNPEKSTIASVGLGMDWVITKGLVFNADYGLPLVDVNNEGNSLQENGFHVSLRYQPF